MGGAMMFALRESLALGLTVERTRTPRCGAQNRVPAITPT